MAESLPFIVWGISIAGILIYAVYRHRKRKSLPYRFRPRSCGPGTVGAIYDLLNEDQRHTMQIIVEGRAEERRPEYPDGNFPGPEASHSSGYKSEQAALPDAGDQSPSD